METVTVTTTTDRGVVRQMCVVCETTRDEVELAGAIRRAIEAVTRERSGVHDHTERH